MRVLKSSGVGRSQTKTGENSPWHQQMVGEMLPANYFTVNPCGESNSAGGSIVRRRGRPAPYASLELSGLELFT